MINNFVVLQYQQIFSCEHQEKKITSMVIFERGLEIPASLCEFCVSNKSKI